jgi:hypothetical protein
MTEDELKELIDNLTPLKMEDLDEYHRRWKLKHGDKKPEDVLWEAIQKIREDE